MSTPRDLGDPLRAQLLAWVAEDEAMRQRLLEAGTLFDGYHPDMETVHVHNAERLAAVIDAQGWPEPERVGEDGAAAAWLILQHSISCPAFMRRGLSLLRAARAEGRELVDPAQLAMLEDRVRVYEGRPQVYGTQHDWDAEGRMSPHPIEDPAHVDARRSGVGLPPLAEATARQRELAVQEGQRPPHDPQARRAMIDAWARRVGWRR